MRSSGRWCYNRLELPTTIKPSLYGYEKTQELHAKRPRSYRRQTIHMSHKINHFWRDASPGSPRSWTFPVQKETSERGVFWDLPPTYRWAGIHIQSMPPGPYPKPMGPYIQCDGAVSNATGTVQRINTLHSRRCYNRLELPTTIKPSLYGYEKTQE